MLYFLRARLPGEFVISLLVMCSQTQGVQLNLNGRFLLQACLLPFQTWVPPWVPCLLLCLWCSQWVLGIEEWCVVYQRETTPYLHHHTLTWRAAISDTFYLVSALVLMDGNRKRNCFKSCPFLSWSRHNWQFGSAVVSLSLETIVSFTHLYFQVSVSIFVYERNCRVFSI